MKQEKPASDHARGESREDKRSGRGSMERLRNWTEQSYGIENGRAVSSLEGSGNMEGFGKPVGKGRQIPTFKRGSTHDDPARD